MSYFALNSDLISFNLDVINNHIGVNKATNSKFLIFYISNI